MTAESKQCLCGEDLNDAGECWQGMITGGHQGNCVVCGKNALLDGERCCSAECDAMADGPCPDCGGEGFRRVTLEMAIDGGDRRLEGELIACGTCQGRRLRGNSNGRVLG